MEYKNGIRTAVIVLIAAFCIIGVIVAAFLLNSDSAGDHVITLPQQTTTPAPVPESGVPFLELTPENVAQAVATLSRPAAYRQTMTVRNQWNESTAVQTVTALTVNGLHRIDISAGTESVHYLIGGKKVYIWYNNETQYLQKDAGTISADDLTMIPTYEDVELLDPASITEASYSTENGGDFLLVTNVDGEYTNQYRIDLTSGLLAQAQTQYRDAVIYTMQQTALEMLDPDGDYAAYFQLPDHSDPFDMSKE